MFHLLVVDYPLLLRCPSFRGRTISIFFKARNQESRRLNFWGYAALLAASWIVFAGWLNEEQTARQEANLRSQITELTEASGNLQDRLDKKRFLLEASINESQDLYQLVNLLEESSRGQMTRVAVSETYFEKMTRDMDLVDTEGNKLRPVKGDEIVWQISCVDRIPNVNEVNCGSFGKLQASLYPIQLSTSQGPKIFVGTRETGGAMSYGLECSAIDTRLRGAKCSLQVKIKCPLRQVQLELLSKEGLRDAASRDPSRST